MLNLLENIIAMNKIIGWTMLVFVTFFGCDDRPEPDERWSEEKASQWYKEVGWLTGANFNPSTAINQLEMWQSETFDLETIDRELSWAAAVGFNTMRVYLHDLVWKHDAEGLLERMNQYLEIADIHGIGTMFVLFDGVWNPFPVIGLQPDPVPHVHNSGWVQSPGIDVLADTTQWGYLEDYVKGVIGHFAHDKRIHVWDIYNEPDNTNNRAYGAVELESKQEMAFLLLKKSFEWARKWARSSQ
jgi:endo-1,4-beta-mannosidase